MKRVITFIALIAVIATLCVPAWADVEKPLPDGNHQVTLSIPDMECSMCTNAVQTELRHLVGVVWAQSRIDDVHRTVLVTFEPSKISVRQLVDAVKKAGFTSRPVEPSAH